MGEGKEESRGRKERELVYIVKGRMKNKAKERK